MDMHKCYGLIFSTIGLLLIPVIANANITLDRVIVFFNPDQRPVQSIGVINIDAERTFAVKTAVNEFINLGEEDLKTIPSDAIAIAPNAFEVASKQKRNVRLLLRQPNTSGIEKVYQVTFAPETPSRTKEITTKNKVAAKIDIIVGMGALVFVPPQKIIIDIEKERVDNTLIINNKSNVSIQLQARTFCKKEDDCFRFDGKRIHPGKTFQYDLPPGYESMPLTFSVRAAGQFSALEIPAPD